MKYPPIHAILAHTNLDKHIKTSQNHWVKTQSKFWSKVKGKHNLDGKVQILQWSVFNPGFGPSLIDQALIYWIAQGVTNFYSPTFNTDSDSGYKGTTNLKIRFFFFKDIFNYGTIFSRI